MRVISKKRKLRPSKVPSSTGTSTKSPSQSSKNSLRKRNTQPLANPAVDLTNLDVARWFIQENLESLPTELTSGLLGAFRARDTSSIRRLLSRFAAPQLYERSQDYYVVAQLAALLSHVQYPFGGADVERRTAALAKFNWSELLCRITTRKLDYYWNHPDRENPLMRVLLMRARGKIDKVLGSIDAALPSIVERGRFGPGMTYCSEGPTRTTPYYKLGQKSLSVSATCRPYADLVILGSPSWVAQVGEIDMSTKTVRLPWKYVTSCRLTFVPKDEKTFRTIAIEPFGNVLMQLGTHEFLVDRLRSHANIDIKSQEWNQRLAAEASTKWLSRDTMSTIDLSSASDCVSPGLVRRLVRPQWVAFLDDLRSKSYDLDGVEVPFSKWSSMGNGYTFALETLLFWALAQVCEEYCESNVNAAVYGDDILVSRRASLLTLEVLRYTGFRCNSAKTSVVGPFRESCGTDFHSGDPVMPIYLENYIFKVTDCFSFLNQLDVGASFSTDDLYEKVLEKIPAQHRHWGPASGSVDTHLHAPWFWLHSVRPPGFRFNKDEQTHYHRTLVFRPKVFDGSERLKHLVWQYAARSNSREAGPIAKVYTALSVQVTQRSRGFYRVSSTRASVRRHRVRNYFLLTMG